MLFSFWTIAKCLLLKFGLRTVNEAKKKNKTREKKTTTTTSICEGKSDSSNNSNNTPNTEEKKEDKKNKHTKKDAEICKCYVYRSFSE